MTGLRQGPGNTLVHVGSLISNRAQEERDRPGDGTECQALFANRHTPSRAVSLQFAPSRLFTRHAAPPLRSIPCVASSLVAGEGLAHFRWKKRSFHLTCALLEFRLHGPLTLPEHQH